MNNNINTSYININNKGEKITYINEIMNDSRCSNRKLMFDCEDIVVNCYVGKTKVSMDDFINDLCNLELRI